MSRLLIVQPQPIASVTASRGTGAANLASRDPKEVWADTALGATSFSIDLGAVRSIDTILLGYVRPPVGSTTWSISGGVANAGEATILATFALRVPDVAVTLGAEPLTSHALWHGGAVTARYLTITVTQSEGVPLTAGLLVIGKAFEASLGREWGFGRQPVDTGSATSLSSGGFAIVEGVRKVLLTWTFGDLSVDEADQLELIGLALGETLPGLVIEDADRTAGLRCRIHYGLFKRWRAFERRNRRQTRWEIGIEQWV